MIQQLTVGDLFAREPRAWGLRGDPYLWRALRDYLATTPLPTNSSELERIIEDAFLRLTRRPLVPGDGFFLHEFAHGGMSSGGIDPQFWLEKALPLLIKRYLKHAPREPSIFDVEP